ncbi:hypothetical protein CIB95_02910 [Lottiidibacillus patelloidae]|uniref:Uncharacterized protein n=1 Tax=Lottiidibacillus patelloidae TaxID=2670334 RepID=A0A263BXU3_9BACI|nr:hypothetical protein [Lottiidibacillus patelloidae]OZM58534.1 hypothetical protein CIB95_02910 [Lottiidibacillus patelloidae]
MRKILAAFILIIILFLVFIGLRFGSALAQEGNPVPYLLSITKYELTNSGYEEVFSTDSVIRYVSAYELKYPYGMAIEFMKNKGWVYKEQLGSGFVFEKNNKIITISTRQYSKHYFIWDVPKELDN